MIRGSEIPNHSNAYEGAISMNIYLYIKTHNKTGLKYLGKTICTNPHKYPGSGVYWKHHLNLHGYDYSTEIIKECQSKEEIAYWGLYYSELWNIVNARDENGKKIWANLRPENGDGGGLKGRPTGKSPPNKGLPSPNLGKTYEEIYGIVRANEKIKKFVETYKKKALTNPKKEKPKKGPYGKARQGLTYEEIFGEEKAKEIKSKHSKNMSGSKNHRYGKPGTMLGEKMLPSCKKGKSVIEMYGEEKGKLIKDKAKLNNSGKNNPMYGKIGGMSGKTHTEEAKKLMSNKRKGKKLTPRKILTCPHCGNASDSSNAKRWHFDNCKNKIIDLN